VTQSGGRHSSAPISEIGMNGRDRAKFGVTLLMGNGTIVVRMLSTKTPAARLPERTLLLHVIGARLIALEAIRELGFASSMLLA